MPELPEVETTVRKLKPLLNGKRILQFNKKILEVERRGKAILIWLEPALTKTRVLQDLASATARARGIFQQKNIRVFAKPDVETEHYLLAFHQRMSGRLLVVDRDFKDKYIRKRFKLSDGKDLAFHDVRRFGVVWYGPSKKVLSDQYFRTLGQDALTISFKNFKKILFSVRGIKSFLLNQKNIAGVGNIMADEILWYAKIHPERKMKNLGDAEIKSLYSSLKFVLNRSIKLGGSTMRDWFRPDNSKGGYFEKRFVYDREGESCFNCKDKIIRKKIAGRSSYFCLKCQPRRV